MSRSSTAGLATGSASATEMASSPSGPGPATVTTWWPTLKRLTGEPGTQTTLLPSSKVRVISPASAARVSSMSRSPAPVAVKLTMTEACAAPAAVAGAPAGGDTETSPTLLMTACAGSVPRSRAAWP